MECAGHVGETDITNFILLSRARQELNVPFIAYVCKDTNIMSQQPPECFDLGNQQLLHLSHCKVLFEWSMPRLRAPFFHKESQALSGCLLHFEFHSALR